MGTGNFFMRSLLCSMHLQYRRDMPPRSAPEPLRSTHGAGRIRTPPPSDTGVACGCRKLRRLSRSAWSMSAGPVGSAVEVGRSRVGVFSFLYWVLRRLLELIVLRMRSEREQEID